MLAAQRGRSSKQRPVQRRTSGICKRATAARREAARRELRKARDERKRRGKKKEEKKEEKKKRRRRPQMETPIAELTKAMPL